MGYSGGAEGGGAEPTRARGGGGGVWAGPASTVQRKSFAFSGGPPRATEGHGVTLRGWALAGPSRGHRAAWEEERRQLHAGGKQTDPGL